MTPGDASEHAAFRDEVRSWLDEHLVGEFRSFGGRGSPVDDEGWDLRVAWERELHRSGWVGLSWPQELGGRGLTLPHEIVFIEEHARAKAPSRVNIQGEDLLGPTMLALGTPTQKEWFCPRILSMEDFWCQGFSEPDAGSDLAGVRTTARLEGDRWVVNGQKLWTTFAHRSNWIYTMCRTDPGAERHRGLSMLLIPMDQDAVDVRPLSQMAGEVDFCEVYFQDAVTDVDNVLGGVDHGWQSAMTALGFERGTTMLPYQYSFGYELERILERCRADGLLGDARLRQALARARVGLDVMRHTNERLLATLARGEPAGSFPSLAKLYHQHLATLGVDSMGAYGQLLAEAGHAEGAQRSFLFSRAETVFGGTNEIQRNIIAERVLGLPAMSDARADLRFRSIAGLVREQGDRLGPSMAIVDGPIELSYGQLSGAMEQVARGLIAAGVEPGDRVALWGPNSAAWIEAAVGIHACGAVLVPVNTRFKGSEAAYVMRASGVNVLFVCEELLGVDYPAMLRAADPDLADSLRQVLLPGPNASRSGIQGWDDFLAQATVTPSAQYERRLDRVGPDSPCDVIFTSGTTGHPKGVVLTHGSSLRAYEAFNAGFGLRGDDRYLVTNPFFHCFGYKAGWMLSFIVGATVLPHAVFNADAVLERIGRDRISVLAGPPTMFTSLLEAHDPARDDLSSLRFAFTAASSIPVALVERMQTELAVKIGTGYGLTESTAIATVTSRDDDAHTVASTVGSVVDGLELRIVDDEHRTIPVGQIGEVALRGFAVTPGYWNDSEATAAAIDAEGWLYTGDIGVLDESGNLRITDRKKDIFIVGGFNVSPVEVEGLLLTDERLAQVAVVGVPDDRLGDTAAAFVVARRGVELSPADVVSSARARMANYKVPQYVEVVDALPVNASGKVLKGELRARAARLERVANG